MRYLLLLMLVLSLSSAIFAITRINATPDITRVIYTEGDANRVNIVITVFDDAQPVSDGTAVYLTTTLGNFVSPTIYTQNGQCLAILENYDGAGRSVINIMSQSGNLVLNIEFLGEQKKIDKKKRNHPYKLKSNNIKYSVEEKIFELTGDAIFESDDVKIEAEKIIYSTLTNELVAYSVSFEPVVITIDEYVFHTTEMFWDTTNKDIFLNVRTQSAESEDDKPMTYTSGYYKLNAETLDSTFLGDAEMEINRPEYQKTVTLVLSTSATVMPYQYVIFKNAKFYLNSVNSAIYSVPYYVLRLDDYAGKTEFNLLSTEMTMTTDLGLNIYVPFHYYADENHIGTLSYSYKTPGLLNTKNKPESNLSIDEEFLLGDSGSLHLYADDVLRDTRTYGLMHNQTIGSVRSRFGFTYGRTTDTSPYATRANLSLSQSVGDTNFTLSSYGNIFGDNKTAFVELGITPPNIKITKNFSISNSGYIGWSDTINADRYGNTNETVETYEGLRTNILFPSYKFLGGSLTPHVSNDISRKNTGIQLVQERVDSSLRYTRDLPFGIASSLSFGHSFYTSNDLRNYPERISTYGSMNLSKDDKYWGASLYGSYNFTSEALSTSASFIWHLPLWTGSDGERKLYFGYQANASSSKNYSMTADHIFSLGRRIGDTGFVVRYSPSGSYAVSGLGTSSGKHWSLELMRFGW